MSEEPMKVSVSAVGNKESKIPNLKLYLGRLFRKRLRIWDLRVSDTGEIGMKSTTQAARIGIFEACEIIRIAHVDKKMRTCAKEIQETLMEFTKAPHNLLPHEGTAKTDDKKKHKLLPRFDVL